MLIPQWIRTALTAIGFCKTQPQTSAAPLRLCVNGCGRPAREGPCPKHGRPNLACSYLCY
eukprot:3938705-Rhodomonas_salina.1